MALPDLKGYAYVTGSSTAGIIYQGEGDPHFHELIEPAGVPFRVPGDVDMIDAIPLIVCSSSRGLVVFHHAAANLYSIGNPFLNLPIPNAYDVLPPPPRFHNVDSTHVVLANSFISPELNPHPVFHLICAVCMAPSLYVFDTYISVDGFWTSSAIIDFDNHDIMLNTGVSCHRFTYWLTQFPHISVLRFDDLARYDPGMETATFWPLSQQQFPFLDHPMTRLQLGRVLDVELGLVAVIGASDVHGPRVELFIVRQDDGMLNHYAVLNLTIQDDVNWNNVGSREFLDALECRDLPRPIRSESFKMEVLLWVDERVVVWENNTVQPEMRRALLLPHNADVHVISGFAHVRTTTLPGIFQTLVDEDDGDDQDEGDDEGDDDVEDIDEDSDEESDEDANNNNAIPNHENHIGTDGDPYAESTGSNNSTITFQDPDEGRI